MNNQTIVSDDKLKISCIQAVQHFRNMPGFQQYSEEEFIQLVYSRSKEENLQWTGSTITNIVLNLYSNGLYQALAQKDDLAYRELGYQELSKYLYRMAYNFFLQQTLDPGEMIENAQECTQMALERIYVNLEKVKSPGGFLKWCGIVLKNVCLGEVRGQKREVPLDDEVGKEENLINYQEFGLESIHDRECLKIAILRLKEGYQQVIKLTYFTSNESGKKMSDEDIAKKLNINIENLYTMRSRALSILREDKLFCECLQVNS